MTREEELEMTNINCYHCKGKHTTIQMVKDCSKVQIGWEIKTSAPTAKPVEVVIPATVVKKSIPAHRAAKKAVISSPVVTTQTEQAVATATAVLVQETKKVLKGQDLELGMYQVDGQIYKIKWNKYNTYKYAEKLVITQKNVWEDETNSWKLVPKGAFKYAPSMMNTLTSENKMTEEMAKAFHDATKEKYGVDYGFCCVCGKLLIVKKSIAAGIGPVCATKL
jgi:hypothetical protein